MSATVVEWEIAQVVSVLAQVRIRGLTFAASGAGARTLKPSEDYFLPMAVFPTWAF